MSGRTSYQRQVETKGLPNPWAAIFKGSEAVMSFFEKHELPVENYRPVNSRDIHFNSYRTYPIMGVVCVKSAPVFIREEVGEPIDDMDPLAVLLLKEEERLMGYPIIRDVEDDDELILAYLECQEGSDEDEPVRSRTLSEWLAMTRRSNDDIELHFTNAEEEHLAQLSDATPPRKSESLRKPRSAFHTRRRR